MTTMRYWWRGLLSAIFLPGMGACSCDSEVGNGPWRIVWNEDSRTAVCLYGGDTLLRGFYAEARTDDGMTCRTTDYPRLRVGHERIDDPLGSGERWVLHHSGLEDRPELCQVLTFYEDEDFFTAELHLVGDDTLSSNYLAPLCLAVPSEFLPADTTNRALRVPFDNDAFVHYLSSPFPVEDLSFEVTALYNGRQRRGLVVGSVEHDVWKTGIRYRTGASNRLEELVCFGGVTHELTRDRSDKPGRPSAEHGSLHGRRIESPRLFVGFFDDWRRGLERFGEVNAALAPPRPWQGGTPFGWNSWAALAQRVSYEGAVSVADFVKRELQPCGFENDGTVYIGLDSFWDNLSREQLHDFVRHCRANGQQAGIYWCPFSDWLGNPDAEVEGTNGKWHYRDIYLRSGGQPRRIESLALDPTHEGTRMRMAHYIGMFRELGFRYLKLDFINNGALEADSFYDPHVTTGIQAYNAGMAYLNELCGRDMFLALSIAPLFPAQYGNSRRISCDTWGAMSEREWGSTGYMLNSLSFGWWLDRVYGFNDADHILLDKPDEAADFGEGANRARITSAVITGVYMLGDNFSDAGPVPGDGRARQRALKVATRPDINDIARTGRSFRPVEGYCAPTASKAERMYMLRMDDRLYVAVFNFDRHARFSGEIPFERLGLASSEVLPVRELWTGEGGTAAGMLRYDVPPQDARIYRMEINE